MDWELLTDVAIRAARAAGQIIQQSLGEELVVGRKEVGTSEASQVVTEVDKQCEAAILAHLQPTCETYDLALLSEETQDDGSRFEKDFFWCIDPMDGTLAFVNKRPGFSVSIALVARDGRPCIGVVFDPSTNVLYHAARGKGAYRNGEPWQPACNNDFLTYVTDRKLRDTPFVETIQQLLNEQVARLHLQGIREMDGAGSVLNAILVLEHGPACMLKLPKEEDGGGSIWDFAATACIYEELGLPATNFAGGRLGLNRREGTFMNREGVFYGNWGGEAIQNQLE